MSRAVQALRRFAHRGNPQALRNWYDDAARSGINWGTAGDFDRCTSLASKYMTTEQAHGFCNLRHQDATGHPPGHAPGEERDKKAHHAAAHTFRLLFDAIRSQPQTPTDQLELRARLRDTLGHTYPADTLDWVNAATWQYDPVVPLTSIDYQHRPTTPTDPVKVAAIAAKLQQGEEITPSVLVKQENSHYAVADGYHRLAAYDLTQHTTVPAWVASLQQGYGPWTAEMHQRAVHSAPAMESSVMFGHQPTTQTVSFKDYDTATRKEFAAKGWALADGSFPIADKADLQDALHRIGTTNHPRATVVAHIRKRAHALGAMDLLGADTHPSGKSKDERAAASATTTSMTDADLAAFSAVATTLLPQRHLTDHGTVIRRGKVFEAGVRTDMHGIPFEFTPAEMARVILDFEPLNQEGNPTVPIGSGHPEARSPLDGKLGHVTNFFLGETPTDLWAEAELPLFVDEVLGQQDVPVSMIFNRWTKQPLGLDFVDDPNVVDAALLSSFARHDTSRGQYAVQRLHDTAVLHGAVCGPPIHTTAYASHHEAAVIQQVHDLAASHGARCDSAVTSPGSTLRQLATSGYAQQEKKKMPSWTDFWKGLFQAADELDVTPAASATAPFAAATHPFDGTHTHDHPNTDAAEPDADDTHSHSHSHSNDSNHDHTHTSAQAAMATPRGGATMQQHTQQNPDATTVTTANERTAQFEAENARLRRELEHERISRIDSDAEAFAESEVKSNRALPAEADGLVALFRQAAIDDMNFGRVKFSNFAGGEVDGSRTELLKRVMAAKAEHWLTREQLEATVNPEILALAAQTRQAGKPQPTSAERRRELLEQTEIGREVLAVQARNGNGTGR